MVPPDAIRRQVERIIGSDRFTQSSQLSKLLNILLRSTLAGRTPTSKELAPSFKDDTNYEEGGRYIRDLMRRLREQLVFYYAGPGKDDDIFIELPPKVYRLIASARQPQADSAQGATTHGVFFESADPWEKVLEICYLLLRLDQFTTGVWGASLAGAGHQYGHDKSDPGSISVSVFATLAMTRATGSPHRKPVQQLRQFLTERRTASGAFGMRRKLGSDAYPEYKILHHARHTATAGLYFLTYDGPEHENAGTACTWLLSQQAPDGGWIDSEPPTDPISTAFVADFLERYAAAGRSQPRLRGVVEDIEAALTAAVEYLFEACHFRTREGFWLYKHTDDARAQRLADSYRYTTEVLSTILPTCLRIGRFTIESQDIIQRLIRIATGYGGLPAGTSSHVPDLDATARLGVLATTFPDMKAQGEALLARIPILCAIPEILMGSRATGWATALTVASTKLSDAEPFRARSRILDDLADALRRQPVEGARLPKPLEQLGSPVRRLLHVRRTLDDMAAAF